MSQTAQQIVTGALRFLRVIDAIETPDANDSDNALTHLNDYLNGLNARGAIYSNTTLVLTDAVPISQELEGDLKRALAWKMQSDWGVSLDNSARAEAIRADQRIVAAHTTVDPMGSDSGLLNMPSNRRPF